MCVFFDFSGFDSSGRTRNPLFLYILEYGSGRIYFPVQAAWVPCPFLGRWKHKPNIPGNVKLS